MALDVPAAAANAATVGDRESPLGRVAAQYAESRIAMLALATLLAVAVIAVTAPLISPQNPYDLRAIDIRDGRMPPGSAKLSRPTDIGMTVSVASGPAGEWPVFERKPRGRAGDPPADALELRLVAARDGIAGRVEMQLAATRAGPLDPLRSVQLRGLPRGTELSSAGGTGFATSGSSRARTCNIWSSRCRRRPAAKPDSPSSRPGARNAT